jgi:hypothetical protein
VVSAKRRSSLLTVPWHLLVFDRKHLTQLKPHSHVEDVTKAVKYNFAFHAAEDEEEKGTFDSILSLKYFIHAVRFR